MTSSEPDRLDLPTEKAGEAPREEDRVIVLPREGKSDLEDFSAPPRFREPQRETAADGVCILPRDVRGGGEGNLLQPKEPSRRTGEASKTQEKQQTSLHQR